MWNNLIKLAKKVGICKFARQNTIKKTLPAFYFQSK